MKCFLFAWVPAWGAGLFLASALVAGLEASPLTSDCGLGCGFVIMDAVPPAAKLAFGALLGAFMGFARVKRPPAVGPLLLRDAVAGAAAAAMVAELLPSGFGIPLIDLAVLPMPTLLWLGSAAAGGMLGSLLERSCRRKLEAA
jgi:hypothetical protein